MMNIGQIADGKDNFVFLGEGGSGKSEVAINLALQLARQGDKVVHFFDMDMTKPLFRSRDLGDFLGEKGICLHFEEQFMDAPTMVGGVARLLRDANCYVVMDVGGDYIGARSIGGYALQLQTDVAAVYYVMNCFRPWSMNIVNIDRVMGDTLGASHIHLDTIKLIGNPNLGPATVAEDVFEGYTRLREMVSAHKEFDFFCVNRGLYSEVKDKIAYPVFPMDLHLSYPWSGGN